MPQALALADAAALLRSQDRQLVKRAEARARLSPAAEGRPGAASPP